ncbi:MAG: hypothetical protein KDC03_12315 [Flavobacteriales bacterium]|nr:hypothetical protein [Flavobacteriales bacterium]
MEIDLPDLIFAGMSTDQWTADPLDDPIIEAKLEFYKALFYKSLELHAAMEKARLELEQKGVYLDPSTGQIADSPVRKVRLKDLSEQVVDVLEEVGHVMTSPQIAAALWKPEYGITIDKMNRRVIVTASALSKRKPPLLEPSGIKQGRAIYWCPPQWKVDGVLAPERRPPGHEHQEPSSPQTPDADETT